MSVDEQIFNWVFLTPIIIDFTTCLLFNKRKKFILFFSYTLRTNIINISSNKKK